MVTISYAITVKDELQEIKRLLLSLTYYIRPNDELVILQDDRGNEEIKDYLSNLTFDNISYKYIIGKFNKCLS